MNPPPIVRHQPWVPFAYVLSNGGLLNYSEIPEVSGRELSRLTTETLLRMLGYCS